MDKLILAIFAFFLSLFNMSPQTPAPIINPPVITYEKTVCKTDSDCILVNVNDRNCCGSTGCEDKSTNNWEAVNNKWYDVYLITCQDGPCPLAQCNPAVVRESFVARCTAGKCEKLGGL